MKAILFFQEQGYIYKMFDFPSRNESTLKALKDTREELEIFFISES
jgi:hypothetical protein